MNNPETSNVAREHGSVEEDIFSALGDEIELYIPQNRNIAESKLRRGKKHCPICLTKLGKIVGRTRLLKFCQDCQAHQSKDKHCKRCQAAGIWENKTAAACQSCGLYGKKSVVIAQAQA